MTIQQLCDILTDLCHEGLAQYEVLHICGLEIKNITELEVIGETVLIKSKED